MSHKKIKIVPVVGTPEWMISYGDLMSCLLVFFVLLLTFSSNKPDKLMDMMGEYIGPGGDMDAEDLGDTTGSAGSIKRIEVAPEDEASMRLANLIVSQKYRDFQNRLYSMGFKHEIFFSQTEDGFYIETSEDAVFDQNGGISLEAKAFLQAMANVALSLKKELRILDMAPIGANGETPASSATHAERNAMKIYNYLNTRYVAMNKIRVTFGAGFSKEKGGKIRFFIAENLEGKAMSLADLSKAKS